MSFCNKLQLLIVQSIQMNQITIFSRLNFFNYIPWSELWIIMLYFMVDRRRCVISAFHVIGSFECSKGPYWSVPRRLKIQTVFSHRERERFSKARHSGFSFWGFHLRHLTGQVCELLFLLTNYCLISLFG